MVNVDFLLLLLLFLLTKNVIEATFPPNQWNALYDLYNSTQGWDWEYDTGGSIWDFSNSSVNPCVAQWQGILCRFDNVTSVYTVYYLDLVSYGLNGSIPFSISQLPNLTYIDLSSNHIYGTIPDSLYSLSQLRVLDLAYNQLNGTISSSISSLKLLSYFIMDHNQLTGSIPEELFNLPLVAIALSDNSLSGKLPNSIGNCSSLQYLWISDNRLSSTLPDSLYNLQNLLDLIINGNEFTGTISEKIGNLQMLSVLLAEENNFFGSLPANFFTRNFTILELSVNLFSGTLPPCTGKINYLSLNGNSFHGTVPASLWVSSTSLYYINLSNNFFHGTVTFVYQQLQGASLNYNLLSGTLPAPTTVSMSAFSLRSNFYTGTVPSEMWNLCNYAVVDVSQNSLYGAFNQTNVKYSIDTLNISSNLFSGSFSLSFPGTFSWLSVLSLSNNFFSGSLINDWSLFWYLHDLDVSSNQFTGELPALFPTTLQVFSASTNCFRGSFPEQWCSLTNMTNWILNGLSSSSHCQNALFPGTSIKTFMTKYGTNQALPECLFELPNLVSLFLSGNELTGSLPDVNTGSGGISQSLLHLDLSHNRLTGTIPVRLQERVWTELDLSFNMLGGTLSASIYSFGGSSSSLKLERNRLSGSVPSSLLDSENINILDGNLFSCNFDSSALPRHDPSMENYSCGSDTTNAAIYLWLGLMGIFSIVGSWGVWTLRNKSESQNNNGNANGNEKKVSFIAFISFVLSRYQTFRDYCVWLEEVIGVNGKRNIGLLLIYNEKMRKTAFLIASFSAIVFLPLFSGLSLYYSVYSERYSWVLSGLFLEGDGSAVALCVGYLSFMVFFLSAFNRIWFEKESNKKSQTDEDLKAQSVNDGPMGDVEGSTSHSTEHSCSSEDQKTRFMIYTLGGLINLAVMLSVDLLYVYISINYDTTIITIAVMILALGKIFWNSYLMWTGLSWCRRLVLSRVRRDEEELEKHSKDNRKRFTKADVAFVSLSLGLNNLIYPAIALLVLSSNCYQDALFQAPSISSFYQYNVTWVSNTQRSALSTITSVYSPPFSYSYQCASVVYAYYAPLFIFIFIFEGLLFPVMQLLWIYRGSMLSGGKKDESEDTPTVEMISANVDASSINKGTEKVSEGREGSFFLRMRMVLAFFSDANDITSHTILFHKHRYVVRFNSYLLTMLIYGTTFPPLALIGLVSIVTRTLFEEVMFGHILQLSKKRAHLNDEVEQKLSNDCKELLESMESLVYILLPVPLIIYSYLVFDTFGQETPVAIGLIPAELLFVFYVLVVIIHESRRFRRRSKEEVSVFADVEGKVDKTASSETYEVANPIRSTS